MSPEVVAAIIAASVSFLTLIGTLVAQSLGRRATSRDTQKALEQQRDQLDRTLAEQREQLDRTLAEQRTRTLNERLATAAEQLGSERPAVRLAGVYAMAGLADDWKETGRPASMCCAPICACHTNPILAKTHPSRNDLRSRPSVKSATPSSASLPRTSKKDAAMSWQCLNFDFTGVVFDGGDFIRAQFSGGEVRFTGAQFSGGTVGFDRAQFSGGTVYFTSAQFSGGRVYFIGAQFSGGEVYFIDAQFSGGEVGFNRAQFSGGAVDFGAQFSGREVDFRRAQFSGSAVGFGGAPSSRAAGSTLATLSSQEVRSTSATPSSPVAQFASVTPSSPAAPSASARPSSRAVRSTSTTPSSRAVRSTSAMLPTGHSHLHSLGRHAALRREAPQIGLVAGRLRGE